jgi:hypothetical protein
MTDEWTAMDEGNQAQAEQGMREQEMQDDDYEQQKQQILDILAALGKTMSRQQFRALCRWCLIDVRDVT